MGTTMVETATVSQSGPAHPDITTAAMAAPVSPLEHACLVTTTEVTVYPGIHAQNSPDKAAAILAGSGETQTYRELDERSNQLAQLLQAAGLREGDHVSIFMENRLEYFVCYWAAIRTGLLVGPEDPTLEQILDPVLWSRADPADDLHVDRLVRFAAELCAVPSPKSQS